MKDWDDLKQDFQHCVSREGVYKFAESIPADPKTVYRLLSGDTKEPSKAVHANIERLIDETLSTQEVEQ